MPSCPDSAACDSGVRSVVHEPARAESRPGLEPARARGTPGLEGLEPARLEPGSSPLGSCTTLLLVVYCEKREVLEWSSPLDSSERDQDVSEARMGGWSRRLAFPNDRLETFGTAPLIHV